MYKYILFDLDGTLSNTSEGVFNSTDYMIKKLGLRELSIQEKRSILGPPLWLSFNKFWNLEGEELEKSIELYREYYAKSGIKQCELYPGMMDLLKELKDNGKILLVATSKPSHATPQVLKQLNVDKLFDYVSCPAPENESTDKSVLIIDALENAGCTNKAEAIMIGDRMYDIDGANKVGIDSIGVTFGFGKREELEEHNATYIADNTKDIARIIK